jgi:hypothetical protein
MTSSITARRAFAVLLAVAALAAIAAQPAAADSPYARFYASQDSTQSTRWCETPWLGGLKGAYGAWGYYVDGCTAQIQCPWSRCRTMQATGQLSAASGVFTTCNMAVRVFTSYGSLRWRTDVSRSGTGSCWANAGSPDTSYGEWVTVQSNGVIAGGTASVKSYVWLAPA